MFVGEKLMTSIRENVVLQPSELERKANEYRQMTAEVGRNMTNSVSNSINSDDSYQENTFVDGRFQEIHANSHYGSLYLPSTTADIHSQVCKGCIRHKNIEVKKVFYNQDHPQE